MSSLARVSRQLTLQPAPDLRDALQQQEAQDLIQTRQRFKRRDRRTGKPPVELERLIFELAETNLGVIALFWELEETALQGSTVPMS